MVTRIDKSVKAENILPISYQRGKVTYYQDVYGKWFFYRTYSEQVQDIRKYLTMCVRCQGSIHPGTTAVLIKLPSDKNGLMHTRCKELWKQIGFLK